MNLKLLIVEDSINYAIELEQLAEQIGYEVIGSADNSADALDIIFSTPPDIILMDIEINGRLSGIDIAKKIKHLHIPILYITSFGDDKTYEEALKSDIIGYIVKPVEKLTLTTALKLLLKNRTSQKTKKYGPGVVSQDGEAYLFFMKNDIYEKVKILDIVFIKSENNYSRFTLVDGTQYLIRLVLKDVYAILKDYEFIRCHRQFIINQLKIKSINTVNNTLMIMDEEIPFSRNRKKELLSIGIFLK